MGIQNGPAPEGGASSVGQSLSYEQQLRYWKELKMQLAESERMLAEAVKTSNAALRMLEAIRLERDEWKVGAERAVETCKALRVSNEELRQVLVAITLERDNRKADADHAQQQATQLRQQVEALEATVEQVQEWNKTLLQHRDELQAQLDTVTRERDAANSQLAELKTQIEEDKADYLAAVKKALIQHESTKLLLLESSRFKLDSQSTIELIMRSPDIGNGWRRCSAPIWDSIVPTMPEELVEKDTENKLIRLSPAGKILFEWTC